MENLRATAKTLHVKIKQIGDEIQAKEKEISKLRESNAALIEQCLGKERKPRSLETQRNAIVKIDVEILELRLVKESLTKKLAQVDADIKATKLRENIATFQEESEKQLKAFSEFNQAVISLQDAAEKLESYSGTKNAIYSLLRLCWNNGDFIKKEIDLNKILATWGQPRNDLLSLNLDAIKSKASEAGRLLNNLWQQLNAVATGSRTIPTSKLTVNHGQRVGTKSEVRMKQAAVEAVENAKQIKRKPFIQHFPQMPPG